MCPYARDRRHQAIDAARADRAISRPSSESDLVQRLRCLAKVALANVRDAAGHCNVSITSGYLHIAVDNDAVGNLFG